MERSVFHLLDGENRSDIERKSEIESGGERE